METTAPTPIPPTRFPAWLRLFEPAPPAAAPLTDAAAIQRSYRSWRVRILLSSIIGYATFYFVRKNLSIAMPFMEKDLGISKSDLGTFLSLHGVLYGVSKFANGFFADRCNARAFMVVGLAASALMNVFFGFGSAVATLGAVWMLNGWFQGMGFPPCARLLTHWFPPKQLATKMSIWNTSHSIGAGAIVVLCGYLVGFNWRLCFLVPAALALACAVGLWLALPDTPPSVGLPEVEGTQAGGAGNPKSSRKAGRNPKQIRISGSDENRKTMTEEFSRSSPTTSTVAVQSTLEERESPEAFRAFVMENVFRNKYIWLVSLANFFVYTLRYAVFDWGPTLLTGAKHIAITGAGWMMAGFEVSGLIGALLGGWLTDRFFGGRAMRACVFYMVLAGLSILLFWKFAGESKLWNTALLCAAGFFIYGPQCLVGIAAANLATKRAAATAVGLTGFFGYASTLLSGRGLGVLVERHGWDAGFAGMLGVAAVGTLLFALAWPAKAHGYKSEEGVVKLQEPT